MLGSKANTRSRRVGGGSLAGCAGTGPAGGCGGLDGRAVGGGAGLGIAVTLAVFRAVALLLDGHHRRFCPASSGAPARGRWPRHPGSTRAPASGCDHATAAGWVGAGLRPEESPERRLQVELDALG